MKKLFQTSAFLGICILLISCGQSSMQTTVPTPRLTSTIIPLPSETPSPIITPTEVPKYIPPTLIPTLDPTLVPELLSKTFSIQTVEGINRYPMKQITGWGYGFRRNWCDGYAWLDSDHLILFPTTGQVQTQNFGALDETSSAVIDLDSGSVWLPPYTLAWNCSNWLPLSSELEVLVLSDLNSAQEGVSIYKTDGRLVHHYQGKLAGVSPSATKILIDNTWIDLKSGKRVDFEWDADSSEYLYFPKPIWSSDEMQVYTCCYQYGNARTGESFLFPYDNVSIDGKDTTGSLYHSYGEWVLNDSYFLIRWDFFYDSNPGFIPLFDPKARTLRNLNTLAGIPVDLNGMPNCQMAFAAPDGQSIWAVCYSGNYLIDLTTFKSVEYPTNNSYDYPTWSANSDFAWMEAEPRQVLSVSTQKLSPLPVAPLFDSQLWWHPTESILAYLSEDGQKLELLDAPTLSNREVALPIIFQSLTWSPDGNSIALLAEDGSLWQIDYPTLEGLEQLTAPLPNVSDINWSPDGNSIAFVSGSDIYIVETEK